MIIVALNGGLGNQLFQYAAGYSLAKKNNAILKFETANYEANTLRKLELALFDIELNIATKQDLATFDRSILRKIFDKFTPAQFNKIYKERFFSYDENFARLRNNTLIKGYWQSEKYFSAFTIDVISHLKFTQSFDATIEKFKQKINNINSVSIHIRKGDYKNEEALKMHGILDISYYKQALALINTQQQGIEVFIFTDAPNEILLHDFIDYKTTLVSTNITNTPMEDFYLMQNCKHNIIANSSFSWWAAYLNKNKEKVIIAPKNWFANEKMNAQTKDLIPNNWICI